MAKGEKSDKLRSTGIWEKLKSEIGEKTRIAKGKETFDKKKTFLF